MFMQGLAFEDAPVLSAGTRAVLPRLRVRCVDACGNPTPTLPHGVAGLEARAATFALVKSIMRHLQVLTDKTVSDLRRHSRTHFLIYVTFG